MNINAKDFDFEGEFCKRINKIHALADLFFCTGTGSGQDRQFTSNGAFGIHYILDEMAEELFEIFYKMLQLLQEVNHAD
jgi:hypothetical protein